MGPKVPDHLLSCPAEPKPPADAELVSDLLDWVEDVRAAGAECRLDLESVRRLLQTTK